MLAKIGWLAIVCLCAGLYASIFGNHAFNDRSRQADNYYLVANEPEPHRRRCNNLHNKTQTQVSCKELNNPNSEKTDLYLWGDSHSSALVPGLTEMAKLHQFNLEYSVLAGCGGVLNMQRADQNLNCAMGNSRVADHLEKTAPQLVLLASSYVQKVTDGLFRSVSAERVADSTKSVDEFKIAFKPTIDRIRATGASVLVLTEPPRQSIDPVMEKLKFIMVGRNAAIDPITPEQHQARITPVYSIIDESGIGLRLDYSDMFCGTGECVTEVDGRSLYKDRSHISNFASRILAGKLITDLQHHGYLNTN
jgi:hypothetical protein